MNTEKAKLLNLYFVTSLQAFNDALLQKPITNYKIDGREVNFRNVESENYFCDFSEELEAFIKQTKSYELTVDYISSCLIDFKSWKGFPKEQNKVIFTNGYEIDYLLNLKDKIDFFYNSHSNIFHTGRLEDEYNQLSDYYLQILNPEKSCEDIQKMKKQMLPQVYKDALEVNRFLRFTLDNLRNACLEMPDTVSKLNYINDQLYDYKQMSLEPQKKSVLKQINIFTGDFEKECCFEIERLTKKLELELKAAAISKVDIPEAMPKKPLPSTLLWKANDTDLLELVVALHKDNIIERKDKKELTRKELIEYFSGLFDLQIKDVEGKLTRATNRNDKTPFLDKLKLAFENYGQEKEEKQRKRK